MSIYTHAQDLTTPFEKSNGTKTATYEEGIEWWTALAKKYKIVRIDTKGATDAGQNMFLHQVVIDVDANFNNQALAEGSKNVIFINNAIHPGEPDGVDACMLLARKICEDKNLQKKLSHTKIVIVPFYNVGGALNRNSHSRANQNGPESYGFRGNAKNYDLNRDFIKQDAVNTNSLTYLLGWWNPDVFIDTHVSNGADYQYTMTLLGTQADKLGGACGDYMRNKFMPDLFKGMADRNQEMTPYVNVHNEDPVNGFSAFYDSPRYGSGYAACFKMFSFVTETHMLKPFDKRVQATLDFLLTMIDVVDEKGAEIKQARIIDQDPATNDLTGQYYPINWVVNPNKHTDLLFKGYQSDMPISKLTDMPQMKYDRTKPYEKTIPYYEFYTPSDSVALPYAYVVPREYLNIVRKTFGANIKVWEQEKEHKALAEVYYIIDYDTKPQPYEGHYVHNSTKVQSIMDTVLVREGDYLIKINDNKLAVAFLVNAFEPTAEDSYFNWGFFDIILQQKEWFSAYVFDDIAEEILKNDPELLKRFMILKKNPDFANNSFAQLYFIYKNSPYYEKVHNRYPIYRIKVASDFYVK